MVRLILAALASAALGALPACSDSAAESSAALDGAFVPPEGYEAGFVEIEPVHYRYGSPPLDLAASRARIFYSFARADSEPARKPILVVFNGGPAVASSTLLAWNTGARTIDPTHTAGARTGPNPSRWTRFANVLYVDARGMGFSYDLLDDPSDVGARDAELGMKNYNAFLDAADIVRVSMRVLARHPELEGDVVPVGESYGGTRATIMVNLVHHPDRYSTDGATYRDDALAGEIAALGPQASRFFQRQILLQPFVAGSVQTDAISNLTPPDADIDADPYDVRKPSGYTLDLVKKATDAVADPDTLRELIGVELSSIAQLSPSSRNGAARRGGTQFAGDDGYYSEINAKLVARLGVLPPWDFYFQPDSFVAQATFVGVDDPKNGRLFLENLADTDTFITNAQYDAVCPGKALASALNGYSDLVESANIDAAAEQLVVKLKPTGERRVRFPTYANSGHVVSIGEPEKLAADLEAWLAR